jgi:hypothetical protein
MDHQRPPRPTDRASRREENRRPGRGGTEITPKLRDELFAGETVESLYQAASAQSDKE